MTKQVINIGSAANDGTGDPIREAFSKTNANFTELYDAIETIEADSIDWDNVNNKPAFADVATTGNYSDLIGAPTLGTVATEDGYAVPAGGTTGQVLAKVSNTDGDLEWTDQTGGGGGGTMSNLVEDTTPQLGGNLDLNTFSVGDADAADLTKLSELTATSTELNYVDGVTSAIQTQLDTLTTSVGTKLTTSLYDAHSILAATTDNTPAALTVGEQTLVGRITAGNIAALTPAQIRTLINVEDGSTGDLTAAEAATLLETLSAGDSRTFIKNMEGLTRASGETFSVGDLPIATATDGEFEAITPVSETRASATDIITGTSTVNPIYPDALGVVGTPTAVASSSGAITLAYAALNTRTTAMQENITAVTITGLTEHIRGAWEVTGHASNSYTITWPTGGTVRAPATTLTVNANAAHLITISKRGSVYWITWSDNLALIA